MNNSLIFYKIKQLALQLGAITVVFLLSFLVLLPILKKIVFLRGETIKQNQKISQLSSKLYDLQTLSEAELFDSANVSLEALPVEKDYYNFMAITKKTLLDNNVILTSFDFSPGNVATPSATTLKVGLQNISMEVHFMASLPDLERLIKSIDNTLPLLSVEGLKISSPLVSSSAVVQNFEGVLTFKGYYSSLPAKLGKTEQPLPSLSTEERKLIEVLKTYTRYSSLVVTPEDTSSVIVGKDNPFPF